MAYDRSVDVNAYLGAIGFTADALPEVSRNLLSSMKIGCRDLSSEERDNHLMAILKRLEEPQISRSTEENLAIFERGWSENLALCRTNGVSLDSLRPKYVKPNAIMRMSGKFIVPENPFLFDDLCTSTLNALFAKYFKEAECVYEFGCGTGRYLYMLGNLMSKKKLIGLDWTKASGEILKVIAEQTGLPIEGARFDMLNPGRDRAVVPGSAIYTVGAMEQIGTRHAPFLSFLIESRPSIVVHHEPILELYRDPTLFDYIAALYHRKRNYLNGYLPALQDLERERKVEILDVRRGGYGDPFNEGSSIIVWRPR